MTFVNTGPCFCYGYGVTIALHIMSPEIIRSLPHEIRNFWSAIKKSENSCTPATYTLVS